ncbi:MAG TPA: DUF4340 domain-containing protein [Clostridiaceae bacterium]
MKKLKNLLILVVVLSLLLCGLYFATKIKDKKAATATTPKLIGLLTLDQKAMKKIELVGKGKTLTLENNSTSWNVVPDKNYKIDATKVSGITASFSLLQADRLVIAAPTTADLTTYGLDKPSYTATVTMSDGSSKTVVMGNLTADGSAYYIMIKGDPKIYSLSLLDANHFAYTLNDLLDVSLQTIDLTDFSYIKFNDKNGKTVEITKNIAQTDAEKSYNLDGYLLKQPYKSTIGVDMTAFQTFTQSIPTITVSSVVELGATDLSKYGLDKPTQDLTLKDSKNSLHLLFGKMDTAGQVYFMVSGSNNVCTTVSTNLDYFSGNAFVFADKQFSVVNIDNVDKIVINNKGEEHTMVITRTTKKATKASEADSIVTTYALDGKNLAETAFKELYKGVIGLQVDAENGKKITGNPEVTVTFYLNTSGKKENVIKYIPYDSNFYVLDLDGQTEFLVSRLQISNLLDAVNKALIGK